MDSVLRQHFLAMLGVDLAMADVPGAENFLLGPERFASVRKLLCPTRAERLADLVLETMSETAERVELSGGIISCPCICHKPIGTVVVNDCPMTSCIHCQLLA